MAAPVESEAFRAALALLRKIRADGDTEHLGLNLAAALGIVLADHAGTEGNGLLLLALAETVMRASFMMRQAQVEILAECRGSA